MSFQIPTNLKKDNLNSPEEDVVDLNAMSVGKMNDNYHMVLFITITHMYVIHRVGCCRTTVRTVTK